MGFRFQKRIKLFPGVRLNLSNGSPSLSIGPRGASLTVGKRGVYANAGIPGSGLSYRTRLDKPNGSRRQREPRPAPAPEPLPPARFNLLVEGGVPSYLDENNNPLPQDQILLIKRYYKDQLLEQFDKRVIDLNKARDALGGLHYELQPPAPRQPVPREAPVAQSAVYPVEKPVRPSDPAALPDFMERLSAWRVAKAEYEARNPAMSAQGEPDLSAIAEPILNRLGSLTWPRETRIDLDLSEDGRTLLLNVDLPEIEDLPAVTYAVSRSAVDIVEKPASATNIAELYARHIHAVALRLIGEAFSASGVIDCVIFDGYSQRLSPAHGRVVDEYVLAIKARRSRWETINFGKLKAIDPVAAAELFELRRDMKSRGSLKAIEPFKS